MRKLGINYCIRIGDQSYQSEYIFNSSGAIDVISFEIYIKSKIESLIQEQLNNIVKESNLEQISFSEVEIIDIDFSTFGYLILKASFNQKKIEVKILI